jgi:hypothetical protein
LCCHIRARWDRGRKPRSVPALPEGEIRDFWGVRVDEVA